MSRKNELTKISEAYEAVVLNELGGFTPGDGRSAAPAPTHPEVVAISTKPEDEQHLDSPADVQPHETETETYMAKSELYKIHRDAKELYSLIKDCDNIEPWVFSKITVAASYLNGVKNYMEYDKFKKQGEFDLNDTQHGDHVLAKVREMLQGESKEVLEGVIRQVIFNLEALQTIQETKQ
ncbi:hypothetical protein EBR43_08660 [bacterium]|nr:hypothetical protein [bacterium]